MAKLRWLPVECLVEQQLTGGAGEQIGPADHLVDLHRVVVGHAGEFVGSHRVAAPDDEVAKIDSGGPYHGARLRVLKLDLAAVGHAEPPGDVARCRGPLAGGWPQGGGKDRLGVIRAGDVVGGDCRCRHIAAGVGRGVDHAGLFQASPDLLIPVRPFALAVGSVGAAAVGALAPAEVEPTEVVDRGLHKRRAAARGVEVVDPQDKSGCARSLSSGREGAGVAHVEEAGGGRGQAAAPLGSSLHVHHSHQAPVLTT